MQANLLKILIVVSLLCFVLGWLFPVEGPYDYVYDNYVKAHRSVNLATPRDEPKPMLDVSELTAEDLEYIQDIILNKKERWTANE